MPGVRSWRGAPVVLVPGILHAIHRPETLCLEVSVVSSNQSASFNPYTIGEDVTRPWVEPHSGSVKIQR